VENKQILSIFIKIKKSEIPKIKLLTV